MRQESLDSPIDRRSDYYRQRAREERPLAVLQQQKTQPQPLLTAPNTLTFLRVLLVPLLVVLWFHPHRLAPLMSAITFIVAAITDWADGYLARRVSTQLVPACITILNPAQRHPVSHKAFLCPNQHVQYPHC